MFWKRSIVIALCCAVCAPAPGLAQQQPQTTPPAIAALPPVGPLQAAIDRARFDPESILRTETAIGAQPPTQISAKSGVLGRIVMAGVLGVAGFLGGGYLGAKIEGPCDCDDPGFKGAIIGAPIGAAVGAIAGWKIGGLLNQ